MSVMQSSGVSTIQGLLKCSSELKDSGDICKCSLCSRCPLFRGVC